MKQNTLRNKRKKKLAAGPAGDTPGRKYVSTGSRLAFKNGCCTCSEAKLQLSLSIPIPSPFLYVYIIKEKKKDNNGHKNGGYTVHIPSPSDDPKDSDKKGLRGPQEWHTQLSIRVIKYKDHTRIWV